MADIAASSGGKDDVAPPASGTGEWPHGSADGRRPPRRGRVTAIALALIALLALAAWWWQRGTRATAPAPREAPAARAGASAAGGAAGVGAAPAVELAPVGTMPLTESAAAVGSLRSRQGVVLRPEVAGRVSRIGFRDGERVRRGQPLVQLDDRLALAQVQQGRAELGIAEANHKRNVDLVGRGFISARAVDESQAAVAVARAKLELAEATAARLALAAPFAGVAGIGNVHVGDVLQAGAEIVHLEDLEAMLLDFRLPERYQQRVRRGQTAEVRLDALPGHVFEAVVHAIDPAIDAEGRTLGVRACIDNRGGLLRPGMFARVEQIFGSRADAVVIPEEAVVPLGGKFYVYRLRAASNAAPAVASAGAASAPRAHGPEVERAEVLLGTRVAGFVEVVRGVTPGERIVVAGQQRLSTPTARVRVVAASSGSPAGSPSGARSGEPAARAAPGAAGRSGAREAGSTEATAKATAEAATAAATSAQESLVRHRATRGADACALPQGRGGV